MHAAAAHLLDDLLGTDLDPLLSDLGGDVGGQTGHVGLPHGHGGVVSGTLEVDPAKLLQHTQVICRN